MEHALVFAAFYLSGLVLHKAVSKVEAHKAAGGHMKGAALGAFFANPAMFDAVREFIIHVVVYSGKVIPAH